VQLLNISNALNIKKKGGDPMATQKLNLFIVDDDKLMALQLKLFLQDKFGDNLSISTFYDGDSAMEKIDKDTNIVILDYFLDDKNGLDILKQIKEINPKTQVVMLSNNEDIAVAIQTFRAGAKDYVVKGDGSWKKITKLVNRMISQPARVVVKGFK
jgi:DNA-binding NarL/FixJ family response regulator